MGIDLHAHTTASDGSFSPTELVAHAREVGLSALGITDHDTIGGWNEAFAAGESLNIEIVPGVELSVAYEGGRFHLLAYYCAVDSELTEVLAEIQAARSNRNVVIFDNLRELGLPLEEAEVFAFAGDKGVVGRPHFAQAMMKRGYVESTQEAFDKYLADGKPAYSTKAVLTPQRALELIRLAGGVSVWAHPPRSGQHSLDELEACLKDWVGWGLDGLETYYSAYTDAQAQWTARMQKQYDLLGTGGSDFHGAPKPTVKLGVTHTGKAVPDEVLDALKARRS